MGELRFSRRRESVLAGCLSEGADGLVENERDGGQYREAPTAAKPGHTIGTIGQDSPRELP
ncbi:hypothetical protein [Nocardiopsis sp. LOL_012]|uniref:hypothetical protein n=1 Tax=Nocardiopsis sp. LOL_012 TaxID=3345409 RepID=UPI003A8B687D